MSHSLNNVATYACVKKFYTGSAQQLKWFLQKRNGLLHVVVSFQFIDQVSSFMLGGFFKFLNLRIILESLEIRKYVLHVNIRI
jgi:hypothetical protein